MTITGRELGQVLAWLALDHPGILGKGEALCPRTGLALQLEGLGGILGALPAPMRPDEWATEPRESMDSILELLHDYVKDLSARLWALEEAEEWTGKATVTVAEGR